MPTIEKPRTGNTKIDKMVHSNDWHSVKEQAESGKKETAIAAVDAMFMHNKSNDINFAFSLRLKSMNPGSATYSDSTEVLKHIISRGFEHRNFTFTLENSRGIDSKQELKQHIDMLFGRKSKLKQIKPR